MSEFKDLLLSTLAGVNTEFNEALADLKGVVAELDVAVKAVSKELRVFLQSRETRVEGSVYVLVLSREKVSSSVAYYMVDAKGYPITFGASMYSFPIARDSEKLTSRQDLEGHFREMLQNKNSPLVVQLAYLMRR